MKIGYVRVSTAEQNTARQEVIMEALEADSVYIDRVSGKDTRRPELQKMLSYLRPLIRGEVAPLTHNGVPVHMDLYREGK